MEDKPNKNGGFSSNAKKLLKALSHVHKIAKNMCTYNYIYILHDHVSIMRSVGQNISRIDLKPRRVEASI